MMELLLDELLSARAEELFSSGAAARAPSESATMKHATRSGNGRGRGKGREGGSPVPRWKRVVPKVNENARAEADGMDAKMSARARSSGFTDAKGKGRNKRDYSTLSRQPLAPIVTVKTEPTAASAVGKRRRRE